MHYAYAELSFSRLKQIKKATHAQQWTRSDSRTLSVLNRPTEKEYFENLDINSVVGTFAKMKNKRKQSVSVVAYMAYFNVQLITISAVVKCNLQL